MIIERGRILIEEGRQKFRDWQREKQEKALASTFLFQMTKTENDILRLKKDGRSLSDDLQDLGKEVEEKGFNLGRVVKYMVELVSDEEVPPEVAELAFNFVVSNEPFEEKFKDAEELFRDNEQFINVYSVLTNPAGEM